MTDQAENIERPKEFNTPHKCSKCRSLYTPETFTYCTLRDLCPKCITQSEELKEKLRRRDSENNH